MKIMAETTTIASVGDLRLNNALRGPLSDALTILKNSDLAFGNLEAPLTEKGEPADKWAVLRQDPKLANEYTKMGFRVLTLANNHMLDYGREGLISTLATLQRAGIQYVGAGHNIDEALRPTYFEHYGTRIAFLGCASTLPGNSVADKGPGLAPIRVRTTYHVDSSLEKEQPGNPPVVFTEPDGDDVRKMARVIRKTSNDADYVIVGIHWGMPYQDNIMDYQTVVGRAFVDAGANLVLGHHAHRLHGIDRYKDGFIFYSLGNFFFEMGHKQVRDTKWRHWPPQLGMWSQSNESVIVKTKISRKGQSVHELIPTFKPPSGRPRILKGRQGEWLLKHVKSLSREDTSFHIKDGKAILE